jgi:hypothetical protein
LALAACKGESGGSGGSGGGSGGSGGGSSGDTSCDGVCNALLSQHCFYTGGDADCRMSCNGWETMYVAKGADYCKKAWDDYKSCIVTKPLTCPMDSDAHWGAVACREHWDHFNTYCINMNATPSTACMAIPTFDTICDAAHPHAQSCFGDVPSGCVVGGTENNSNLYCCP